MKSWDDSLRELGDALVDHPTRTQLVNVLRFLRRYLGARAAVTVQAGYVSAHDGHATSQDKEMSDEPAVLLAHLATQKGVAVRVDDTREGPFGSRNDGAALHAIGYTGAIAVPLLHRGVDHGGIVLWFGDEFDEEIDTKTLPANYILSAVRQLLTLSFERDNRSVSAEGALTSLGEVNRLASLGMMLDSTLFSLRGPSSSLLIQIDELRRLTDEIGLLADPTDHPLGDALGELSQTLDDITLAASLVRKELTSLSDLSETQDVKERVQLSRLVHEAVVIARPELEHRGYALQERIVRDGYVHGDRHELLHLCLGLLFAWTRDEKLAKRQPILEIQLDGDDQTCSLRVAARTPQAGPPPTPPAACQRILDAHRGYMTSAPGALEAVLPIMCAPDAPDTETPRQKRILLVDDDPMFARALRRALNPHDVRVCGTASDAEMALLEPGYAPDMVICDLWLPGTNGRILHERIALSQPNVAPRFVFVSGAPVSSKDRQYFMDSGCKTLAKPIMVSDLFALLDTNPIYDSRPADSHTRADRQDSMSNVLPSLDA